MSNKNSVSAFSLIETVVSMAITAIIMGIVFVIFSIVTERMLDYKNQNELVNDLNRLTYSINKDIFENEKMLVIENEMVFNGYAGETVKYNFQEEYILRSKETFIDTFKIKLNQIVIDSVKNKSQRIVFQKLKLNVEVNEREMDLKFYKRVYANELLQAIKE
ncbi:PulJ/GspJ family protein [Flavobacterium yafengii]|uniref:PulJ/GspJ family protein n=1 Tax=Flavobacterium yafengii TaxID=3041253 RepID=UPI0024A9DE95|nr:prepilin-type N-terminal cleavage/methylation domain-containing protein [Flavobacterium yafengii]MDI5887626.1 prepilin-type N-terminal cleavage/methylation domain-containing protein [Flavobacterium yafengii]